MVSQLAIVHYRKLQGITLDFSDSITFISGPNGTCKSSLLHMISNAFQEIKGVSPLLSNKRTMQIIRGINPSLNPKIETLTKGDKQHQDPAKGIKGTLFTVKYMNGMVLNFRRHNSKTSPKTMRYAIKPSYTSGSRDRLPQVPVLYLGLPRLYPYGEFQNDAAIEKVRHHLPEEYEKEVIKLYSKLAHINISNPKAQRLKDVKPHTDFDTSVEGLDSNTISSGEDNLYIIVTALVSLRFFYESQQEPDHQKRLGSILLIDEFDATLHPSMQEQLLDIIQEYSKLYKIQMVSTTHSLSLLEYAFRKKIKVIYLKDDIERVIPMPEPDIYKIRMNLRQLTRKDIYDNKCIPVFTEDEEAREILDTLLSFMMDQDPLLGQIKSYLHLVEAPIGAESLRGIFSDRMISAKAGMFCVLDGDKQSDLSKNIICLPGKNSPEKFLYSYALELYDKNVGTFWQADAVQDNGFDRAQFRDKIKVDYDAIEESHKSDTAKKPLREALKKFYCNNIDFFRLVFLHWLNDDANKGELNDFVHDLKIMFKKTAPYHSLNPKTLNPKMIDGKKEEMNA